MLFQKSMFLLSLGYLIACFCLFYFLTNSCLFETSCDFIYVKCYSYRFISTIALRRLVTKRHRFLLIQHSHNDILILQLLNIAWFFSDIGVFVIYFNNHTSICFVKVYAEPYNTNTRFVQLTPKKNVKLINIWSISNFLFRYLVTLLSPRVLHALFAASVWRILWQIRITMQLRFLSRVQVTWLRWLTGHAHTLDLGKENSH